MHGCRRKAVRRFELLVVLLVAAMIGSLNPVQAQMSHPSSKESSIANATLAALTAERGVLNPDELDVTVPSPDPAREARANGASPGALNQGGHPFALGRAPRPEWPDAQEFPHQLTDGSEVGIALPRSRKPPSRPFDSDVAVFADTAPSTDTAVQPLANGAVRQITVVRNESAPTTFTFPMDLPDGYTLKAQNGGVLIQDSLGRNVDGIAPPWAHDADGAPVPVRYTIEGENLVMHLDHGGFQYPVVADPCWSCWVQAGLWVLGAVVFWLTLPVSFPVGMSMYVFATSVVVLFGSFYFVLYNFVEWGYSAYCQQWYPDDPWAGFYCW